MPNPGEGEAPEMVGASHHKQCDWHCDQYDFECTCGATRPKADWFDGVVKRAAIVDAQRIVEAHGLTAEDAFGPA